MPYFFLALVLINDMANSPYCNKGGKDFFLFLFLTVLILAIYQRILRGQGKKDNGQQLEVLCNSRTR